MAMATEGAGVGEIPDSVASGVADDINNDVTPGGIFESKEGGNDEA